LNTDFVLGSEKNSEFHMSILDSIYTSPLHFQSRGESDAKMFR